MNKLKEQVHSLGIRPGVSLFVHSSVKAVGHGVRAEEVISLLREAVGDDYILLHDPVGVAVARVQLQNVLTRSA